MATAAPARSAFADEPSRAPMPRQSRAAASATPMPHSRPRPSRAQRPFDPRWSVWGAGFGGSQTTDGNAALGSNTATSRVFGVAVGADYRLSPRPSPASRWPAAAPVSVSTVSAADDPTCSRPAPSSATPSARPMSPPRWPMAGRTSRPIAPSPLPASTGCARTSTPTPSPAASKAAIASSRRGSAASAHALCRRPVHHLRPAGLCRTGAVRRQHLCADLRRQERHRDAQRTRPAHRQILCDARTRS